MVITTCREGDNCTASLLGVNYVSVGEDAVCVSRCSAVDESDSDVSETVLVVGSAPTV